MSALDSVESSPSSSKDRQPRRSRHPSSASLRSIGSARSPRPIVWRPPNTLNSRRKDSLSVTSDVMVSTVVAGAEMSVASGSSLRERMEAFNVVSPPEPVPVEEPPHPSVEEPMVESPTQIPKELVEEPEPEPEPLIEPSPAAEPEKPEAVLPPQPIDGINVIAFPIPASTPPSSGRPSSSWFGSLSRARGKEQLASVAEPIPDPPATVAASTTKDEATPEAATPEPVMVPEPTPTQPVTVPEPTPTKPILDPSVNNRKSAATLASKRSWFSSSPVQPSPLRAASPPQPILPISRPRHRHTASSSVDSVVPTPASDSAVPVSFPLPTSPSDLELDASESADGVPVRRRRLSSLNPSIGRFSISLPLIGGNKAVTSPTISAPNLGSGAGTEEVETRSEESHTLTTTTNTTTVTTTIVSDYSPSHEQAESSAMKETMVQSGSWWDYVGWGTGLPPPAAVVPAVPSTETVAEVEPPDEGESTPKPIQQSVLPEPVKLAPASDDADKTIKQVDPAWYSPWAWYGSAGTLDKEDEKSLEVEPPASEVQAEQPPQERPLEEADVPERPEVEAPATISSAQQRYWTSFFSSSYSQPQSPRSTAPLEATPSSSSLVSADSESVQSEAPSLPLVNPIGESIIANRSSWVSFFTSSGSMGYVARKSITSGEPEVMEVDFDGSGDEAESNAKTTPPPTPTGKEFKAGKAEPPKSAPTSPTPSPKQQPVKSKHLPAAPPLTISDTVKRQVANNNNTPRSTSPSPGTKSPAKPASIAPPRTPTPNLVLPAWKDTFHTHPRVALPRRLQDKTAARAVVAKTMKFVSGVLFAGDASPQGKGKGVERDKYADWGMGLPRAWDVVQPQQEVVDAARGCKSVAVIGIHGWFPGAVMRSVLGEPTGTSAKFANMMVSALEEFQTTHGIKFDKITRIPLDGEGTIERRVEKLYAALTANEEWMTALHEADVIFVATHSQGSIVSTHILDRLIRDRHIRTDYADAGPPQRVCCLALCGIHLGPLRYLNSSSLLLPYIQYFESVAAKELFEFQNTESEVSKAYVNSLRNVLNHGIKMVYVASENDQVVPMYSGLFTAASHPLILRALYIDGDAYHSSDFLSNLLVLLLKVLNAGLPDSGLITHLSEATAGSLNGIGHSTPYEELGTYSLAVKYLFLTNTGFEKHPELVVEPFDANVEQNDYEIPWSLRDIIADQRVAHFFGPDIVQLAGAFKHWHPRTAILRDIKRKLQPIQRLPATFTDPHPVPPSRL